MVMDPLTCYVTFIVMTLGARLSRNEKDEKLLVGLLMTFSVTSLWVFAFWSGIRTSENVSFLYSIRRYTLCFGGVSSGIYQFCMMYMMEEVGVIRQFMEIVVATLVCLYFCGNLTAALNKILCVGGPSGGGPSGGGPSGGGPSGRVPSGGGPQNTLNSDQIDQIPHYVVDTTVLERNPQSSRQQSLHHIGPHLSRLSSSNLVASSSVAGSSELHRRHSSLTHADIRSLRSLGHLRGPLLR